MLAILSKLTLIFSFWLLRIQLVECSCQVLCYRSAVKISTDRTSCQYLLSSFLRLKLALSLPVVIPISKSGPFCHLRAVWCENYYLQRILFYVMAICIRVKLNICNVWSPVSLLTPNCYVNSCSPQKDFKFLTSLCCCQGFLAPKPLCICSPLTSQEICNINPAH